jgi:hypothetical protein
VPLLKAEKDALAADAVKPKPGPVPFKSPGTGPQTRGPWVPGIFSFLKAIFCLIAEQKAFEEPGKAAPARAVPGKKSCFEAVFEQAQKSNVAVKTRMQGKNLKKSSVKNYQRPLALRGKTMCGCFKRHSIRDTGIVGRVEPVARIRPVGKI